MKTLKFFFILSSLIILSCSSDDEKDIVGSWSLQAAEYDCTNVSDINSASIQAENGCFSIEGDTSCFSAVFSEDGTMSIDVVENGDPFNAEFTYTFTSDTQLDLCFVNDPSDCVQGTFDGDTFTFLTAEEGCEVRLVFSKG